MTALEIANVETRINIIRVSLKQLYRAKAYHEYFSNDEVVKRYYDKIQTEENKLDECREKYPDLFI